MVLSEGQVADLTTLQALCGERQASMVVIGAAALFHHYPEVIGYTADTDLVVPLDWEEFAALAARLRSSGWRQRKGTEHRWDSAAGSVYDLLPAGKGLREVGVLLWPESQFQMSLSGMGHVFDLAEAVIVAPGLELLVAPPAVLALLKIIAFAEAPERRRKDLPHLRAILERYEQSSERWFSDHVIAAELSDFGLAGAFLLGCDLRALCTRGEIHDVGTFMDYVERPGPYRNLFTSSPGYDWEQADEATGRILEAFRRGFGEPGPGGGLNR